MYLCICNAIRQCEFSNAARKCRGDASEVYASLGKRPQCGQCLDEAEAILDELHIQAQLPVLVEA